MGVSKYTFEEKKDIVVDFLREHQDKGYSQGELARQLMFQLGYETEMAARVSIGKLLDTLAEMGICAYRSEKPKRGFLSMKVWYLKNDGVHQVSGKKQEA